MQVKITPHHKCSVAQSATSLPMNPDDLLLPHGLLRHRQQLCSKERLNIQVPLYVIPCPYYVPVIHANNLHFYSPSSPDVQATHAA